MSVPQFSLRELFTDLVAETALQVTQCLQGGVGSGLGWGAVACVMWSCSMRALRPGPAALPSSLLMKLKFTLHEYRLH
jgi:hypothetical protein